MFSNPVTSAIPVFENNLLESLFAYIHPSLPIYTSYFPLLSSSTYPAIIESPPSFATL